MLTVHSIRVRPMHQPGCATVGTVTNIEDDHPKVRIHGALDAGSPKPRQCCPFIAMSYLLVMAEKYQPLLHLDRLIRNPNNPSPTCPHPKELITFPHSIVRSGRHLLSGDFCFILAGAGSIPSEHLWRGAIKLLRGARHGK